jgi:hypothetical protein
MVDLMISQPSALGLGSSTPMKSAAATCSAFAGSSKGSVKDTPLSKAIDGVFWNICLLYGSFHRQKRNNNDVMNL